MIVGCNTEVKIFFTTHYELKGLELPSYILILDGARQSKQALIKLKSLMINYQDIAQLKELAVYLKGIYSATPPT